MPFTIEVDDRQWDVENLLNALRLPVEREYVAEITVDEPTRGEVVFFGDVVLQRLDGDVLVVAEFHEDEKPDLIGAEHRFDVSDIRRISFY